MLLSEGASHKPPEKSLTTVSRRRLAQGNQATQAERRRSWDLGTGQELGNLDEPLGIGFIVQNKPGGFRCEFGRACRRPFFCSAPRPHQQPKNRGEEEPTNTTRAALSHLSQKLRVGFLLGVRGRRGWRGTMLRAGRPARAAGGLGMR